MRKRPYTQEQRQLAEPYVRFFMSSVGYQRVLEKRFPGLYKQLLAEVVAWKTRQRAEGMEALVKAISEALATVQELVDTYSDRKLRKALRDRLLAAVTRAYDEHFPRPGGRSADVLSCHEAVMQKARGAKWSDISTKERLEYAEEDRARKAVDRDRETLTGACLWLISVCGPGSDSPPEAREEFDRLSQEVRKDHLPYQSHPV